MSTKQLALLLLPFALFSFVSCNPEAEAHSGTNITIRISPTAISSGFALIDFEPDEQCYYLIGIAPIELEPDTTSSSRVKAAMQLALDEAYKDYINWRFELLANGTPYIAEFPSHSLQYGPVTHSFTGLIPGAYYYIYAFVVNAQTNKPDGKLFITHIHMSDSTVYPNTRFEYRVRGKWDYIYPVDVQTKEILSYVPWVGETQDSLTISASGDNSVQAYFLRRFNEIMDSPNPRILNGIYAHNNDGEGDGTSDCLFEVGHTYYTGIGLYDGYFHSKAHDIYKFTWQGDSTDLFFVDSLSLTYGL